MVVSSDLASAADISILSDLVGAAGSEFSRFPDLLQTSEAAVGLSLLAVTSLGALARRAARARTRPTALGLRDDEWNPLEVSPKQTEQRVNELLRVDIWGLQRNIDGLLSLHMFDHEDDDTLPALQYSNVVHKDRIKRLLGLDRFVDDRSLTSLKPFLSRDDCRGLDSFHLTYLVNGYLGPLAAELSRVPAFIERPLRSDLQVQLAKIRSQRLLNRPLLLELGDLNVQLRNKEATSDLKGDVRQHVKALFSKMAAFKHSTTSDITGFRMAKHCKLGPAPIDAIVKDVEQGLGSGDKVYASYLAPSDRDPVQDHLRTNNLWRYCRDVWWEPAIEGRKMRLSFVPNKSALSPRWFVSPAVPA
ncbi:MAG: hypothetical protein WEB04_03420 [Dehalococcoidia bacterium]